MSGHTFNPVKQALADRAAVSRIGVELRRKKRICWSCMCEKPLKGGTFPARTASHGLPNERFMCADCGKKKEAA